jgi:hypothetical protein
VDMPYQKLGIRFQKNKILISKNQNFRGAIRWLSTKFKVVESMHNIVIALQTQ